MESYPSQEGFADDRANLPQYLLTKENEEMESPSRDLQQKWKKFIQGWAGANPGGQEVAVEDRESNWPDLPMELLIRIMALVDYRTIVVVSGVCTAWRDSLRFGITELSFSWCRKNVSNLVQSLAPKFSKVRVCNLRRCPVADVAIAAIGKNLHDLRDLDLTGCTLLTDESLLALATGCTRLEKLNLSGCIGITDVGLVALAKGCSSLRQLNLCGCDNAGLDYALVALGAGCSELQYLNVGWCDRITDKGVTAVALGCPDLAVVDLCGCHFITDRSVMVLADHCPRLRALNLYGCQITDLSMYSLAEKGNNRRAMIGKMSASQVNNSGITGQLNRLAVAADSGFRNGSGSTTSSSSTSSHDSMTHQHSSKRGYPETLVNDPGSGLMSLNLSQCVHLSAAAVQAVCNAYPALHTCPDKCSLNISGCLNLTSVHCKCGTGTRRERGSRQRRTAP
ncbi:hypothetical protein R1flu_027765 [Riccia fluitans]|uniref:F-box domain-containing protein n=1 Tax=Riccia fluitans TaxID=41844 RepID=A0ABD1XJS3_9MARC